MSVHFGPVGSEPIGAVGDRILFGDHHGVTDGIDLSGMVTGIQMYPETPPIRMAKGDRIRLGGREYVVTDIDADGNGTLEPSAVSSDHATKGDVATGDTPVRTFGEPGSTFIQWKGTNVCMDLRCFCSEPLHIDADFAYAVKCHACERVLVLGTQVAVMEDDGSYAGVIVESDPFDS